MEHASLFQDVVRYIGEYLEQDVSHLRPESRVATAIPGLDSIKLFEMTLYLEDRLGVEFDETVMEHIETMQDLVDYVATRTSGVAETT
ncbi:MAG TPA: acyl carrier protein [Thermoanaerobaculia bacterium]|jgi:acyl carrier protein|nr:acyl carrier protein [Thermoanaerobaculia bacterium]